ncbi:restriction endonuclease [Acetobacter oryzifermentans]|uniref:restriction endonuclease n=1 Tax=Acetobacter oryzifermentans TaxID=1633874 RepID=UPI0039BF36D5
MVCSCLKNAGWDAQATKQSDDQGAIVVTNSTFSAPAREAAATTGVYLIHHAQLVDTADKIFRHFKYS